MKILGLTEENIRKDIRKLFRLEKQTKAIKDRILRDIKKFLSICKTKKVNMNQ